MPLTSEQSRSINESFPELNGNISTELESSLSSYFRYVNEKKSFLFGKEFSVEIRILLVPMIVYRHHFTSTEAISNALKEGSIKSIKNLKFKPLAIKIIMDTFLMMEDDLSKIAEKTDSAREILKNITLKFFDSLSNYDGIQTDGYKNKLTDFRVAFNFAIATLFFLDKNANPKIYQESIKIYGAFRKKLKEKDVLPASLEIDNIIHETLKTANYSIGKNRHAFHKPTNEIIKEWMKEINLNSAKNNADNNTNAGFANADGETKTFRPFSS